jgi:hypothetical protein
MTCASFVTVSTSCVAMIVQALYQDTLKLATTGPKMAMGR